MKLLVNILLITIILATTVIPLQACQIKEKKNNTQENNTVQEDVDELLSVPPVQLKTNIIVFPSRNVRCLEGQSKDRNGVCRVRV